ncbi:ABC transporter ATP-binding protein [Corynebacterium ulcerans]|uniref:Ferrichrome ABC transporter ATP-binding protein n=1 Tax=Corynebacterium ulcerans TaxID=65058 RepID=A0ABD0BK30_CORUL|nr:ABC transporter ATP-binding protein [Corynebacterium ulcerans]AEG83651.1 Sulfate/thiosulfate import ATP-binding protein [Corynebacterium ulcerans BR-AD22]KPH76938.1 molybdate ABC transporter substrate-binding protein [Corynebacterium ulcerans]MBH5298762.1 ABC transporter ATP-binding protein [Corynebacterium ulcerans]MBH5301825.1 ABC transporter ATP-binding protein [Corynebacterium ulcerans]NOL59078.1 ABC transporter ATP-binding protein [Corynebacterium ulcerans]
MTRFQAAGVACGFDRTVLLRDVDFTVDSGTMTAIVGVNGVGKSTLLRVLAGIRKPHAGKVFIDDVDVHSMRSKQRAKALTFVGQEETPPGDLTVKEAVCLGRLPHTKVWQFDSKEETRLVNDALQLVGLQDRAAMECASLSGGQRRRVLFARGFAQGTDLIFLDEPTNHLDVHHQLHLLKVLRDSGRTIIATVHDLDLAMSHFDHVVVLDHGGVVASGPPESVLIPETLRKVFEVEAFITRHPGASSSHVIIDSL